MNMRPELVLRHCAPESCAPRASVPTPLSSPMAIGFTAKELAWRRATASRRLIPRLMWQLRYERNCHDRQCKDMRLRHNNAVDSAFQENVARRAAEAALADLRDRLRLLLDGEPGPKAEG